MNSVVPKLQHAWESAGGLVNMQVTEPRLSISDSVDLRHGLRRCISSTPQAEADATLLGTTFCVTTELGKDGDQGLGKPSSSLWGKPYV